MCTEVLNNHLCSFIVFVKTQSEIVHIWNFYLKKEHTNAYVQAYKRVRTHTHTQNRYH